MTTLAPPDIGLWLVSLSLVDVGAAIGTIGGGRFFHGPPAASLSAALTVPFGGGTSLLPDVPSVFGSWRVWLQAP